MTVIEKSPLARLVLFMVCLSFAGAFLAGAHYYVIDLPQQKALAENAPANWDLMEKCNTCMNKCVYDGNNYFECKYFNCATICADD